MRLSCRRCEVCVGDTTAAEEPSEKSVTTAAIHHGRCRRGNSRAAHTCARESQEGNFVEHQLDSFGQLVFLPRVVFPVVRRRAVPTRPVVCEPVAFRGQRPIFCLSAYRPSQLIHRFQTDPIVELSINVFGGLNTQKNTPTVPQHAYRDTVDEVSPRSQV